jgi:hypothetical protein
MMRATRARKRGLNARARSPATRRARAVAARKSAARKPDHRPRLKPGPQPDLSTNCRDIRRPAAATGPSAPSALEEQPPRRLASRRGKCNPIRGRNRAAALERAMVEPADAAPQLPATVPARAILPTSTARAQPPPARPAPNERSCGNNGGQISRNWPRPALNDCDSSPLNSNLRPQKRQMDLTPRAPAPCPSAPILHARPFLTQEQLVFA